ncbi:hypothetical protein L1049_002155 [Liquidambar formosana]|uniref:F-box domain-containing protein n=1 Tax=Liquidambar formosana TaxID=63359 RepID=A0AAP0NGL5_LIQFO
MVEKKEAEISQPKNSNRIECEKQEEIDKILINLPSDVLNSILLRLPIWDIMKTTVLSKDWRYKWATISEFVFDSAYIQYRCKSTEAVTWDNIKNLVNRFLLNHSDALIEKFKLTAHINPNNSDLCQWLHFLSKNGVKEFLLDNLNYLGGPFELPSSLYSFEKLSSLELKNFTIKLPLAFEGFKFLASLHLTFISIDDDTLENLISSCPILQRLTLYDICGLSHLRIHGPNLKYLKVHYSKFENVSFENSAQLRTIDIWLMFSENISNLLSALGRASGLESLSLHGHFLLPLEIPHPVEERLHHVTELHTHCVNFKRLHVVEGFLSLLCRFPNLEEFHFSVENTNDHNYIVEFVEDQSASYISFQQLQAVTMGYYIHMAAGLEFLKVLLPRAPMLEKVTIIRSVENNIPEKELGKIFGRLKQVSPGIKFIYQSRGMPISYIF